MKMPEHFLNAVFEINGSRYSIEESKEREGYFFVDETFDKYHCSILKICPKHFRCCLVFLGTPVYQNITFDELEKSIVKN